VSDPTYVYIIACGDMVKIGVSKAPDERLKTLRTGMPETPYLVRTRLLPNRRDAYSLERRLHGLFRDHRTNGEWFRVPAQEVARAMSKVHFHREGENSGRVVARAIQEMLHEPRFL
jgi:hypothetical protein